MNLLLLILGYVGSLNYLSTLGLVSFNRLRCCIRKKREGGAKKKHQV